MIVRKITVGWVTQYFDTETDTFISQDFTAGDQVDFEDENSDPVDCFDAYLCYDMVQPLRARSRPQKK